MRHQNFSEQRIQQRNQHDEEHELKASKVQPLPQNLNWKYQNLIFWIPVAIAFIFILVAVVRQSFLKQEKLYCFKSSFNPTNVSNKSQNASRQALVNTRYGYKIFVDLNNPTVSGKIAQSGSYDPSIINLLGHLVKQGDQVLMAGLHFGLEAISVAKIVGSTGKLIIFQPYSFEYNLTLKNMQQNQVQKNVKVYKIAPSNQKSVEKKQNLITDNSKVEGNQQKSKQQINYDKIDEVLDKNTKIDLAYLNTQFLQLKALLGMKDIIRRSKKLVIVVKLDKSKRSIKSQNYQDNIINFVTNHGYKPYSYEGGSHRQSCTLGEFIWKGEIQNFLSATQDTLVLIPKDYTLPK